jgi:general secretion pathway protein F
MRYELKAIAPGGNVEALDFQAPDEAAAVKNLEGRGYTVLSVRAKGALGAPWRRSSARFPVALFSQELRALVGAGLPLLEAIETLAQKEKRDELRATLSRIAAVLREGQPLSAALEEFPQAFSPLYVATVKAAEKTSDLAPALARYVAYAGQIEAVRKRIVNASIYPALLMIVGGMVGLFLLLYVVPRFGAIYQDRGANLPLFSRLLLAWGNAIDRNGPLALGALAALFALAAYFLSRESVRRAIGDALWRLPSIGERLKVYQLARFYRTIGMLLRGGLPLARSCCTRCCATASPPPTRRSAKAAACRLRSRRRGWSRRWRCACSRSARRAATWARCSSRSPPSTTRSSRAGSTGSRASSSRC